MILFVLLDFFKCCMEEYNQPQKTRNKQKKKSKTFHTKL